MAGYVFLFRGGALHREDLSPEDMQRHMQKWQTWVQQMTEGGIYKGGEPLETGGRYVSPGGVVSDGPFPEAKEMVAGYIAIDADGLDQAVEVAKGCPIYEYDGQVEVRKIYGEKSDAVHRETREAVAVS